MSFPPASPDWTDAACYSALLSLERHAFAWEWLRRDPRFQGDALEAIASGRPNPGPLRWRLHAFRDPGLAAPAARPVWVFPPGSWVVRARAEPCQLGSDGFELRRFDWCSSLVVTEGVQRLLLSDGRQSVRLDVAGAALDASPVLLHYELCGIRSLQRPLLVLRRFRSLADTGRFAAVLHPPLPRARRLVLMLRTFDGLRAGATQADIAEVLLSPRFERLGWRNHSPSLRSQAQRLASGARRMAAGGFWKLLE